jgi:membrane protein
MTPTADPAASPTSPTLLRRLLDVALLLRGSALAALDHDIFTVAQATAYSAMIALFPALIVIAAMVGLAPSLLGVRTQLSLFFARVLPSNVSPILDTYFSTVHSTPQTTGALLSATVVSLTGAASVMATLMEGFRRAHELPLTLRSFWPRRIRALALVPLSLVPMALASVLVVFGHLLSHWLAGEVAPELRAAVYVIAFVLRWIIALAGSVGIIAVIYHLGTDINTHMREQIEPLLREPWAMLRKDWSWRASLPGATVATLLWFVSTLLFGYYVTRFANYSRVYGSLGAAIALMFWLYIIALSVLIGAEFNAQRAAQGPARRDPRLEELLWKIPGLRQRRTGRMSD